MQQQRYDSSIHNPLLTHCIYYCCILYWHNGDNIYQYETSVLFIYLCGRKKVDDQTTDGGTVYTDINKLKIKNWTEIKKQIWLEEVHKEAKVRIGL